MIDNNSTDNTPKIVQEFEQVKYFCESTIGLSKARNRGICEAIGLYVAFLDDECRINPEWLRKAMEIITNIKPLAFGGPFYAWDISPKPKRLKMNMGTCKNIWRMISTR